MVSHWVVVKPAGKSLFDYKVSDTFIEGRSGQPLLDACRALKHAGEPLAARVTMIHSERYYSGQWSDWALRTTVGGGAALDADDHGFRQYRHD